MWMGHTYSEREKGQECDGMGTQSPVELAGSGSGSGAGIDVGHFEVMRSMRCCMGLARVRGKEGWKEREDAFREVEGAAS